MPSMHDQLARVSRVDDRGNVKDSISDPSSEHDSSLDGVICIESLLLWPPLSDLGVQMIRAKVYLALAVGLV